MCPLRLLALLQFFVTTVPTPWCAVGRFRARLQAGCVSLAAAASCTLERSATRLPAIRPSALTLHCPPPRHRRLDGRHVVFGTVLEGFDVVKKIEATPTGPRDRPRSPVVIRAAGEL